MFDIGYSPIPQLLLESFSLLVFQHYFGVLKPVFALNWSFGEISDFLESIDELSEAIVSQRSSQELFGIGKVVNFLI